MLQITLPREEIMPRLMFLITYVPCPICFLQSKYHPTSTDQHRLGCEEKTLIFEQPLD